MAITHDLIATLNDLIEICRDGESGFGQAANAITDPSVRHELANYSNQRRGFAAELEDCLMANTNEEEPVDHGSVAGAAHRGWMNLRSALVGDDEHAILAECERGEDYAVSTYRKVIEAGLPEDCDRLVQAQYELIKETHDRIRILRDATRR